VRVWLIHQYPAGNVFDGPHYLVVRADSESDALGLASDSGLQEGPNCPCCSPRWPETAEEYPSLEAAMAEVWYQHGIADSVPRGTPEEQAEMVVVL
jgi:hypothetical protein